MIQPSSLFYTQTEYKFERMFPAETVIPTVGLSGLEYVVNFRIDPDLLKGLVLLPNGQISGVVDGSVELGMYEYEVDVCNYQMCLRQKQKLFITVESNHLSLY